MTSDMEKQEVLFENSFLMTQERYLFICSHPKTEEAIKKRRSSIIAHSIYILVSICLFINGIIRKEIFEAYMGLGLFLVLSYKLFFQSKIIHKKRYSMIRETQKSEEWNSIARFYKSGIEVEDVNNITKIGYNQISGVTDDGEECLLWIRPHSVLRLMHSEFTVGSYEDFAAFINQKIAENAEEQIS